MRPGFFFALLFSLSSFITTAQNNPASFSIRAEAGPSFPVGRFSQTEYYSNYEGAPQPLGLAKTGVTFSVIPAVSFDNHVSLLLRVGAAFYERDVESQTDFYQMIYGVPGTINISKSTWKLWKVMPGVAYSFNPNNSRFTLEPRVSLGLVKTKRPGHTVSLSTGGAPYLSHTIPDENIPAAFCFELTGAAEYKINRRMGIYFGVSYFDATAKDQVASNNIVTGDPQQVTVSYALNSVSIIGGVRIKL